jgi:hypothetical protein
LNTSAFRNLHNVRIPLSISGRAPDFYHGPQDKRLAPKIGFFTEYKAGIIDAEGYTSEFYRLVLNPLDPKQIYEELIKRYGSDVTLLCYERPGEFCHRRLVAGWFENNLGVLVPELPEYGSDPEDEEED